MKRNVAITEISDGRLYGNSDMVRADTGGCAGCSACCHGMGNSIILDPYDVWRLCRGLEKDFASVLGHEWAELNLVDGLILPNLKMKPAGRPDAEEACAFLDGDGRCRIHANRPGVCRLFPLGRYYEGRDFRYFLQIHECQKENRAKVKVKKWIDTPQLNRYETYIRDWHYFLEDAGHLLDESCSDALRKQVTTYLLKEFYLKPWPEEFYEEFEKRLADGKQYLGIA